MPVLFILLLGGVGVIALLNWAHGVKPAPPEPYWAEQIEELGELGRYKHVTAAQYADFASTAETERQTGAALLFHALSRSELVHEMSCADGIRRLGGRYTPPLKVIVLRGHTPENLHRAYDGELQNYNRYHTGIRKAIDAENRYAARTMIRIAGGDMHQIELLDRFILHPDSSGYAVCPLCGNLFRNEYCDCYCPFCLTSSEEFIRFE